MWKLVQICVFLASGCSSAARDGGRVALGAGASRLGGTARGGGGVGAIVGGGLVNSGGLQPLEEQPFTP